MKFDNISSQSWINLAFIQYEIEIRDFFILLFRK